MLLPWEEGAGRAKTLCVVLCMARALQTVRRAAAAAVVIVLALVFRQSCDRCVGGSARTIGVD